MTHGSFGTRAPGARFARARRGAIALALVAALLLVSLTALPSVAHAEPAPEAPAAEAPDPASIIFRLKVQTDVDLTAAALTYTLLNAGGPNVGGSLNADVSPGRTVDLAATLQTNSAQRYIPVGTRLTYTWTVTDRSGGTATTPPQEYVFLDGRFTWSSKTQGQATVYWYGGNEANANAALTAAADSIAKNEALLDVKLDYPVRLVLYRNSAEGRPAQQPRGAVFEGSVITGGSRVGSDLVHLYDPLAGGLVDVTRHEVAHIMTRVAGFGGLASIPSWLDEGTAVYAQTEPGFGYTQALALGVRSDRLLRLRSMASASNQPEQVDLFYGQSGAIVKFMVDTYGEAKFAAIFKGVKSGLPIDTALQQNIGVDQDGLYNAWRKSVGLKEIDFPPVTQGVVAAAQATQAPLTIPTSVGSAAETASGDPRADSPGAAAASGTPVIGIVVGLVSVLLAGGIGFLGLRLSRKR